MTLPMDQFDPACEYWSGPVQSRSSEYLRAPIHSIKVGDIARCTQGRKKKKGPEQEGATRREKKLSYIFGTGSRRLLRRFRSAAMFRRPANPYLVSSS